jgi:drug/metabolite transporter (DMT)-like permease
MYWFRVLLGGFLIEVVLAIVLVGGFAAAGVDIANGVSPVSAVIIGVGCFAAAFLIVVWLGRGIQDHLVVHGFLMGLVATLLYLGLVVSVGVYILSNYAVRHLPVGRMSLLGCLSAPLGAMLSALLLGTQVSTLDIIAVGLVIFAVALPSLVQRRSRGMT